MGGWDRRSILPNIKRAAQLEVRVLRRDRLLLLGAAELALHLRLNPIANRLLRHADFSSNPPHWLTAANSPQRFELELERVCGVRNPLHRTPPSTLLSRAVVGAR